MTTKLDHLKSMISENEILSTTQTQHIKGGFDGDDLRRNARMVSSNASTTGTNKAAVTMKPKK
jgi:hypothetical protein